MTRQIQLLLIVLALVASPHLLADRPTIGLVLSGGGARGAAHIGVLKVLEANRIPIDYIAGTSMGSIVGGLYASGLSPEEIEIITTTMDWDDKLSDRPNRRDVPLIAKQTQELFSVTAQPGLRDGSLQFPKGLIQGQNILPELQRLTHHVAHINDFGRLPIPFQAVATDIATGNMAVLKSGDLALAMRSSMAVPSIFTPTALDDMLLVDGGLTNNLPVDIVQSMGADIIIAVDISSPYLEKDEISNILGVTDQMTRMLTVVNTNLRHKMLTPRDILIMPPLGDINSTDFDRAGEAIPIGETAALAQLDALRKLAVSEDQYNNYLAARNVIPEANNTIRTLTVKNTSKLHDRLVEELVTTQAGEVLDRNKVEADLYRIYSLGNFESVAYRLDHDNDGVDLYLDATAKSWGPNYLYMGLDMEGDFSGNNIINISAGYSREEITPTGGIWTSMVQIGDEPALDTHIYLPLTNGPGAFVTLSGGYTSADQSIFSDNDEVVEYRLKQFDVEASVGWEFSRETVLQFGMTRIDGKADILVGSPFNPEPDYDDGLLFIRGLHDSLNNRYFPSEGSRTHIEFRQSFDSLGADADYKQLRLHAVTVMSFADHHRVALGVHAGTTNGDPTISSLFTAGGGPTLMGLKQGQLIGEHLAVAQLYYYREYTPLPFLSGYIGGLLEYGGIFEERDEINAENSIASGSIWFAVDTPVGPLQFGVGATDKGDVSYYTRIGRLF